MRKIFDCIVGISLVLALVVFESGCKKDTTSNGKITAAPHDTIPATPPGPVTYALLWSDEFSGTSVADTNWTMETGSLHVNNEKEYYQASNATVESGNLVIIFTVAIFTKTQQWQRIALHNGFYMSEVRRLPAFYCRSFLFINSSTESAVSFSS